MKIQCDVCHKQEASLFCPADEAALCNECDHTIHYANKLASKHKRFSLHHPTSKYTPLCDICREKRAYLFCKEDRSILCRECDLSIHLANEHTKKHNRFLLTGVKISASSSSSSSDSKPLPSNSTSNGSEIRTSRSKINRTSSFSSQNISSSSTFTACETVSTSSISEYLIETIPGYCMEEIFDASFATNDYEKNRDLQMLVPQSQVRSLQVSASNVPQVDSLDGVLEMSQTKKVAEGYLNWGDNGYGSAWKVPSISPTLIKQCRRSH